MFNGFFKLQLVCIKFHLHVFMLVPWRCARSLTDLGRWESTIFGSHQHLHFQAWLQSISSWLVWYLQVLDMFGSLLERPLVATYALTQYPRLVAMFEKELDCCRLIYDGHLQTSQKLGESPDLLYFLFMRNSCNDNYYNNSNNSLFIVIYTLPHFKISRKN